MINATLLDSSRNVSIAGEAELSLAAGLGEFFPKNPDQGASLKAAYLESDEHKLAIRNVKECPALRLGRPSQRHYDFEFEPVKE